VLVLTGESPAGRGTTMVANGSATVFGNAIGSALGGLLLVLGGYTLLAIYPPLAAVAAAFLIWRSGQALRGEPATHLGYPHQR
jgi:predicted MFS family arabinose efflux permease